MGKSFSLSFCAEATSSSCSGVKAGALFGLSLPAYGSPAGSASTLESEGKDDFAITTGFGCCCKEKEIFGGLIGADSS